MNNRYIPYHSDCKNERDKTRCTYKIAAEKSDISICEKIYADERWKKELENCRFEASFKEYIMNGDTSICQDYYSEDKAKIRACLLRFAEESGNPLFCENLLEWPDLYNTCYNYLAVIKKDSSLCNKIKSESMKNFCKSKF